MNNKTVKKVFEKCINCGTETPYDINDPIHLRFFYIEGVGQLCWKCYEKFYGPVSKR